MKQGPCLPHCYKCSPIVALAAYAAFVYCFACAGYLTLTRTLGTPFLDSLTAEQRRIKKESARHRTRAFVLSALLGAIVVALAKPLSK